MSVRQGIFNGQGLQNLVGLYNNADTTTTRFGENGEVMNGNMAANGHDMDSQTFGIRGCDM